MIEEQRSHRTATEAAKFGGLPEITFTSIFAIKKIPHAGVYCNAFNLWLVLQSFWGEGVSRPS